MNLQVITYISLVLIGLVFVGFTWNAARVYQCAKIIKKAFGESDSLEALEETKLSQIVESYRKSINININEAAKTNIPAGEYFSEFSVCKANGINAKMLDAGSGTLVGLGLLGTFLGLTLGIQGFDSSNSENIQSSIQSLLDGMGTAFLTSLLGMFFSLVYTFIEKGFRNCLSNGLYDLNEKLDAEYYIDDIELSKYNQETLSASLYDRVKTLVKEQSKDLTSSINDQTENIVESLKSQSDAISNTIKAQSIYTNADGVEVPVANAVRKILTHNEEQTRALKSFSSDLALELNNGFDEVLSRQMQQKILPLMESVDATTKSVVEHIDAMALQVSSPATDMIEQIVSELKASLAEIMSEFKSSISDNASKELENLALTLGSATTAMGRLPKDMENISSTLQITIDEVKKAISEIANSSQTSNSHAMAQMQEQITFATTAINNAIMEVRDVMMNITKSSQESSQSVVDRLSVATDRMADFLNNTVGSISNSMSSSMETLAASLSAQQDKIKSSQDDMLDAIKAIMVSITQQNEKSTKSMVEQMAGASGQMSDAMSTTVGQITSTVSSSIQSLTEGVSAQQMRLTSSQDEMLETMELAMSSINENSEKSSQAILDKLSAATAQMSEFLNDTVSQISATLSASMQKIAEGIASHQSRLSISQEEILNKFDSLVLRFAEGINRVHNVNESVAGTMDMFRQAQGEITTTTSHLHTISIDLRSASEDFQRSQTSLSQELSSMEASASKKMGEVIELIETAGETTNEYTEKFEVIRSGLAQIFSQLQSGLTQYSTTVQESIQRYLSEYSKSLNETTGNLASTINMQNEMVEMLIDTVNRKR